MLHMLLFHSWNVCQRNFYLFFLSDYVGDQVLARQTIIYTIVMFVSLTEYVFICSLACVYFCGCVYLQWHP